MANGWGGWRGITRQSRAAQGAKMAAPPRSIPLVFGGLVFAVLEDRVLEVYIVTHDHLYRGDSARADEPAGREYTKKTDREMRCANCSQRHRRCEYPGVRVRYSVRNKHRAAKARKAKA